MSTELLREAYDYLSSLPVCRDGSLCKEICDKIDAHLSAAQPGREGSVSEVIERTKFGKAQRELMRIPDNLLGNGRDGFFQCYWEHGYFCGVTAAIAANPAGSRSCVQEGDPHTTHAPQVTQAALAARPAEQTALEVKQADARRDASSPAETEASNPAPSLAAGLEQAATPADEMPELSNITKDDVAAFVNSLRSRDTPWHTGCAAVLASVWSDREQLHAQLAQARKALEYNDRPDEMPEYPHKYDLEQADSYYDAGMVPGDEYVMSADYDKLRAHAERLQERVEELTEAIEFYKDDNVDRKKIISVTLVRAESAERALAESQAQLAQARKALEDSTRLMGAAAEMISERTCHPAHFRNLAG